MYGFDTVDHGSRTEVEAVRVSFRTFGMVAGPMLQQYRMRTLRTLSLKRRQRNRGLFLLEATIGMALLGLLFMALYSGLATTSYFVKLSRENLRATQLMAEKLDTIRLYGWKKIVEDPTYIPQRFYPPLYSDDPSTAGNNATTRVYTGQIIVEPAPFTESYADDLRVVTVKLSWVTGKMARTHSMSTLVSKYGVYKYVY